MKYMDNIRRLINDMECSAIPFDALCFHPKTYENLRDQLSSEVLYMRKAKEGAVNSIWGFKVQESSFIPENRAVCLYGNKVVGIIDFDKGEGK